MKRFIKTIVTLTVFLLAISAWAEKNSSDFLVYKHPQCGCCSKWITHLSDAGFSVTSQNLQHDALNVVKQDFSITPEYQSCHTAVSAEGYVFEGHIPADYIQQFLNERPEDAIGLAVPGMPIGSPGMEMGERFDEYKIFLLMKDGSSTEYAIVNPR